MPEDDGSDIEYHIGQLMRKFNGVQLVVGIVHTGGKQKAYTFHQTNDAEECRRLVRMLWQAVLETSASKKSDETETE